MSKDPYKELLSKLSALFGGFDEGSKKFSKASNSDISRELGYSDAQFSRLINQHATEGEYQRANQNADRILKLIELEKRLEKVGDNPKKALASPRKRLLFLLVGLTLGAVISYFVFGNSISENPTASSRYDMLEWSFETSYINPYTKLKDLPDDCEFPCYKYQGKWELEKPYKLPVFRERNGFHYVATDVRMYNTCKYEPSKLGNILEGYEYQSHEIWYDMREWPMDSFMISSRAFELTPGYQNMKLEEEKSFVKIANIHTFFRNEFRLDSTEIIRSGKVIGRDVEFVERSTLLENLGSSALTDEILKEVNAIIINRLEDFSRPINCDVAPLPKSDFHAISNGDLVSFECKLTTSRVSIDYTKTYRLVDQFIKNKCQPTEN